MNTRKYTSLPYTEYDVAEGHFDTARVYPLTKIVLHSSASTKQGIIDTFAGGTRMVSAHYAIDNDGSILAFLEEYNVAYHAGNYPVNQSSIAIEHIDNGADVKLHTDQQYATSIKLVADICKFWGIPCDAAHVVPHSAITPTACPNGLDVNRIVTGAQKLLGQTIPSGDDCPTQLKQVTDERDRLNTVIGTVKDPLITRWSAIATMLKIQAANMDKAPELCIAQIQDLQKSVASFPDQLTGELAKASADCQTQLSTQRSDMLTEETNKELQMKQDFDKQLVDAKKGTKIVYKDKIVPLDVQFKGANLKTKAKAVTTIMMA